MCILCTSALPLICASPFLLCLSEVCSIHGLLALLGEILHSGGPKWQLHKLCPPGMNSAYMVSSPVDHADYEGWNRNVGELKNRGVKIDVKWKMVSYTTHGFSLPLSIQMEITTGLSCQRLDVHIAKKDFIPTEQSLSELKCSHRGWITSWTLNVTCSKLCHCQCYESTCSWVMYVSDTL